MSLVRTILSSLLFFFVKQKTAYEMRISDWSSDVCSSDLWLAEQRRVGFFADAILMTAFADLETAIQALRAGAVDFVLKPFRSNQKIGRASCRERVCQYV